MESTNQEHPSLPAYKGFGLVRGSPPWSGCALLLFYGTVTLFTCMRMMRSLQFPLEQRFSTRDSCFSLTEYFGTVTVRIPAFQISSDTNYYLMSVVGGLI